jgi:hypothetical protein
MWQMLKCKTGSSYYQFGNVYSVYHDWGNAIQAQILQIEGMLLQMIMIVCLVVVAPSV